MNSLLKKLFHRLRPLLTLIKFIEILAFAKQMRQTYLMVEKVWREVCAMTIRDGGHALERILEPIFKFLSLAALAVEDQRKIHRLRYLCPIKTFVSVASGLVKANHRRGHYKFLYLVDGGLSGFLCLVYPVYH